jgi:hypothetical protein
MKTFMLKWGITAVAGVLLGMGAFKVGFHQTGQPDRPITAHPTVAQVQTTKPDPYPAAAPSGIDQPITSPPADTTTAPATPPSDPTPPIKHHRKIVTQPPVRIVTPQPKPTPVRCGCSGTGKPGRMCPMSAQPDVDVKYVCADYQL